MTTFFDGGDGRFMTEMGRGEEEKDDELKLQFLTYI